MHYHFLVRNLGLSVGLLMGLISIDVVAQDNSKNDDRKESAQRIADFQYDGIWKPKGAMLGGVLLPPPALQAITLKIEGDRYEVNVDGEDHADTGMCTRDESTSPMRMTIKSSSGPNKGKTFLAIYEIKGQDAIRVCYDLSGKDFPKEFKSPRGSQLYLVGYRRQTRPKASGVSNEIGNREQPTDTQLHAFAKGFCVAMRRQHDEENFATLREYFDPRYLKQHGVIDGEFNLEMVPVVAIRNIQLADDRNTLLCQVETKEGKFEVFLLRTVVRDGKLYLSPVKPPDATSKRFKPWILRVAL